MGVVEAFGSTVKPKGRQKQNQTAAPERRGEEGEEDEEAFTESEEQREKEDVDLVPIVDSVFGQVRIYNVYTSTHTLMRLKSEGEGTLIVERFSVISSEIRFAPFAAITASFPLRMLYASC